MEPTKRLARISGMLYLIVVLTGFFALMYVPSQLINWSNPANTVTNIAISKTLFACGILASATCYVAFVFLGLSLYKLLQGVNEWQSKTMAILMFSSVPVSLLNLQNNFTVLSLLDQDAYLSSFSAIEIQNQIMLHLYDYNNGILIVSVFWGLWLFPFGHLVYKSGFFPKFFGIFLMLGGVGYLVNFIGKTLMDDYATSTVASLVSLPSAIGEIGICLWLLIVGIRKKT